eukprot:gb/GECG01000133.1/.p1 GENE.gb/GECG01000133.1/~~gb/GECG01000133.1/.p1  ORF type:complete len:706 (+),score=101.57 gb/GECG01000133.1/:1-2118(+)
MEEERKDTSSPGRKRNPDEAHHDSLAYNTMNKSNNTTAPTSSQSATAEVAGSTLDAPTASENAGESSEKPQKRQKTEVHDSANTEESTVDKHDTLCDTGAKASTSAVYPGEREGLAAKTTTPPVPSSASAPDDGTEEGDAKASNHSEAYLLHLLTFFIEVDYVLSQHLDRQQRLAKHIETNVHDIVRQMIHAKRSRTKDLSEAFSEINGAKDPFDYISFIEEHSPGTLSSHFAASCLSDEKYVDCYRSHEKTIEGQEIPILAAKNPQVLGIVSAGFQQELESTYEVQQTPVQYVSNELSKASETLDQSAELAVRYTVSLMPSQEACFQIHCGNEDPASSLELDEETCHTLLDTMNEYISKKIEMGDVGQCLLGATSFRLPPPWKRLLPTLRKVLGGFTSEACKEVIENNYRVLFERWGIFNVSKYFEFFKCLAEHSDEEVVARTCQRLVADTQEWHRFCDIANNLLSIDLTSLSSYKDHNERLRGDAARFSNLKPEEFAEASGWFAHRMFDVSLHALQQLVSMGEVTTAVIELLSPNNIPQVFQGEVANTMKQVSANLKHKINDADIPINVDEGCVLVRRLSQAESALKAYGTKCFGLKSLYPSPPHCAILEALQDQPTLRKLSYSIRFAYGGDASLVLALLRHGIGRWDKALNDPVTGWCLNAVTLDSEDKTKLEPLSFIPCCIHSFLWHKVYLFVKAAGKSID